MTGYLLAGYQVDVPQTGTKKHWYESFRLDPHNGDPDDPIGIVLYVEEDELGMQYVLQTLHVLNLQS
jgi:hypothetical protein